MEFIMTRQQGKSGKTGPNIPNMPLEPGGRGSEKPENSKGHGEMKIAIWKEEKGNSDLPGEKREKPLIKVRKIAEYFYKRRGTFQLLGVQWIFCDLLALVLDVGNFLIIDVFLGGIFIDYGISAIYLAAWEPGLSSRNFPKMTKCNLNKFGVSGSIEKRDILCMLSLNLYFSKMFLVLWFWYLFLMATTLLSIADKLLTILFLKKWPWEHRMGTRGMPTRVRELGRCTAVLSFADCAFFSLFARNLRPITYKAFVWAFIEILEQKMPSTFH